MLEFMLVSKSNGFKRTLTPLSAHVELLWDGVSTAELTFDDDASVWGVLERGDRVIVLADGVRRMAGPWVKRTGSTESRTGTLHVEDDFRLFRLLGWPKPSAAISAQTDAYRRYTGTTEAVVKAACADLSARLGLGWVIPASTGLGSTGRRVEFRFHPLVDKLAPLVQADQLTWSIVDKTVDVKLGKLFPRILTRDTGVIESMEWAETAPTATRVVVGGEGEGTARVLQQFVDSAREADWFTAEVFKDSRMAQGVSDLSPDGQESLDEGAGRVSLKAQLNETSWFRFGKYLPGDRVRVQEGPVDVTEVIRLVVIDESPDQGVVVSPSIGDLDDDADSVQGRAIAGLGRSLRDVRSR